MIKYVNTKEKHPVKEVEIRQPVKAVCKSVGVAQERTLSFHKVKSATVEVPEYQTVKQVHGMELSLESVNLQKQDGLVPQRADVMISNELVFDDRKSKRVKNNLTLRELFSEQEGY